MAVRPGTSKSRRPAGALGRMSAALSCGAAALLCGVLLQAAVARQTPEQKVFRTAPKVQFVTYVYSPRGPETAPTPDGREGTPARPGTGAAPTAGFVGSPVIFYSGEWGWRPLQQDTSSYLASTGRLVLGIDATEYFSSLIPDEGLAADFAQFRAFVNERAGRPKDGAVILVGFASGAEIIPYMLNRIGASGLKGAVLIAPDKMGAKLFRVSIQLKLDSPPGEEFDVGEELRRMAPIPVVLMEGSLDADSAAKALAEMPRGPHKYAPVVGGDRQFHEVRDGFFTVLADALRWIDSTAPGPLARPGPPAVVRPGAGPGRPVTAPVPAAPAAGPGATPPGDRSPRAVSLTPRDGECYIFRAFKHNRPRMWGRNGFDGTVEAGAACRGPLLVKQVELNQAPTLS